MRQGAAIFAAMGILFLAAPALTYGSEIAGNPAFASLPIDQSAGNKEGKEDRFGGVGSRFCGMLSYVVRCRGRRPLRGDGMTGRIGKTLGIQKAPTRA